MKRPLNFVLIALLGLVFLNCAEKKEPSRNWRTLEVTASAYNSVPSQTSDQPNLAAWGDTLKPGMKCIAVSRDLIAEGLEHNTEVKIEGLEGIYLVKDKMNKRWVKRIDIYMGTDIKKARNWGKKKLKIHYEPKADQISKTKS